MIAPSPEGINIALVDDHVLMRDALALVINKFDGCEVILRAKSGKDLLANLSNDRLPNLVILDLNMPDMDGYETAKWLHANYPKLPVLVLTMYDSEMVVIRLIQLGVRGVIKKDIDPGKLWEAIKTVIQGEYYFPGNRLVGLLQPGENKNPVVNNIILTEKEFQFLQLACTDKTYKEIAAAMKISPRTVENYRDTIFVKLNVKSRVGLVLFAMRSGMHVL